MGKINIVLADRDEWYIESLGKYAARTYPSKFNIYIFTKYETLKKHIEEEKDKIHVLLIGESMYKKELNEMHKVFPAILVSNNLTDEYEGRPCIYKYQPAEKIISQCMDLYFETGNYNPFKKYDGKTAIIASLSPQGGSGRTLILYTLACICAGKGFKTMYINFESIPSLEFYTGFKINSDTKGYGLSRVLLYLKEGRPNIPFALDKFRNSNDQGVDFLNSADCGYDIEDITPDEISKLLNEIKSTEKYDFVFVDYDHAMSRRNMAVMEMSKYILLILNGSCDEDFRIDALMKQMKIIKEGDAGEINNKIIPVVNYCRQTLQKKKIFFKDKEVDLEIPYDNNAFYKREDGCVINMQSNFFKGVENIASCIYPQSPA